MNEGDSGNTLFTFTVSTDLTSSKTLQVTATTADGTEALAGTDYTALTTPAVIAAGTTSTTVTVSVTGDQIVEIDETFTLNLTDARFNNEATTDATRIGIGDNQGVGTITNDDTASIIVDDVTMNEGDSGSTLFTFTVSTDLVSSKALQVTATTADGNEALAGTDYTTLTTPAVIAAGTTSTTVTVSVTGDQIVEIDETFTLNLTDARFNNEATTDASQIGIGDNQGVGTITNDDTASIIIDDVTMNEGDSGNTLFTFTVSTDLVSSKALQVTATTADGNEALAGDRLHDADHTGGDRRRHDQHHGDRQRYG